MTRLRGRVRALVAALAVPLLACSESTGPAGSLAGTWVREELYQSLGGDDAVPTTIPDTLVLRGDGTGRWSFGNYAVDVMPTPRATREVTLERIESIWILHLEPCDPMIQGDACFTPTLSGLSAARTVPPWRHGAAPATSLAPPIRDGVRRTTMVEVPWRLTREDDVLYVEAMYGMEIRQRYRRRTTVLLCPGCGG